MKAVAVTAFGAAPSLMEVAAPQPGPGEVLIRLHAAGVNPFDWKVAEGVLKDVVPHAFPLVLGNDGAGVIEQVGAGVSDYQPGDHVYGQFMDLERGHGTYAEYTIAAADGKIARIPLELPFTAAAALPTASITAYQAIRMAGLQSGQTILINGATGGVGQFAVQFAAQAGARVLATATPALSDHILGLGASEVIDFTSRAVSEYPRGVDVVLDLVHTPGGDIDKLAEVLRPGGTLLNTNHAAGSLIRQDIRGVNVTNHATTEELTMLAELAATGKLQVTVGASFALADAPAGIAEAKSGNAFGKTVVTIA